MKSIFVTAMATAAMNRLAKAAKKGSEVVAQKVSRSTEPPPPESRQVRRARERALRKRK